MRPDAGQVCHASMVVSYCRPGSPQTQEPSATARNRSRAGKVSTAARSRTAHPAPPPIAATQTISSKEDTTLSATVLLFLCTNFRSR